MSRKKTNRNGKPALRMVSTQAASEHESDASLCIGEAEEAAQTSRSVRFNGKLASQVWRDLLLQLGGALSRITQQAVHLMGQVKVRRANRRLQLRESVSLGDKRFVAIVQVDGQEFLLGGAPNSVSMLAQLSSDSSLPTPAFSQALKQQCEANRNLA